MEFVSTDTTATEYPPVLVITDDGRDVDDVTALAYMVGANANIVGIVLLLRI